jgi:predicted Zn-dependent protease
MGKPTVQLARAKQSIRLAGWSLTCLLTTSGLAEPRPEAYWSGPDHYAQAREALQSRQWSHALELLQRLSHQMPSVTDEAEFHNLTGFALRQNNPSKLPDAIDHYQQALRIDPAHVQAREYLGQAYLMQGRADLAEEQLQRIEHHCLGRLCDSWRRLRAAIDAAASADPVSPRSP